MMTDPDFSALFRCLAEAGRQRPGLHTWLARLPEQLQAALDKKRFPEFNGWWQRVQQLPAIQTSGFDLQAAAVRAFEGIKTNGEPLTADEQNRIRGLLQGLMPWRKGPFELQGVYIDTEWRSDFKWDRLKPHLGCLDDRLILDVGGGSGYHAWRLAGEGAALTLCIDPSPRFYAQFEAVKKLLGCQGLPEVFHLPVGIEAVPDNLEAFDLVLSMGVLYHRRSPIDHLLELKGALRPGGELVLETLVIEGDEQAVLVPEERYAAMRNVWFLPSVAALKLWLRRAGFQNIRCVNQEVTSTQEQRATEWMTFQSLADFLDPENPELTREGYPAPVRALLLAEKPE